MGEQAGAEPPRQAHLRGHPRHVDSGKTTLAEAMLYRAGALRRLGRVDHPGCFSRHRRAENARAAITIFAKQAVLALPAAPGPGGEETVFTLLDTPGHVDFSAEAERTLQVLDYAILVVSGTDGVQAPHPRRCGGCWSATACRRFVFINKMDLPGADRPRLRLRGAARRPLWRRLCGLWPRCARRRPRRGAGHGQRTADGAGAFGRGPAGGGYRHGHCPAGGVPLPVSARRCGWTASTPCLPRCAATRASPPRRRRSARGCSRSPRMAARG